MKALFFALIPLAYSFSANAATELTCASDLAESFLIRSLGDPAIDSSGALFQLTATNMQVHEFRAVTNVIESRGDVLVLNFTTVNSEKKLDDRSIHARLELPMKSDENGVRSPAGDGRIVITRRPTLPLRFLQGSYALLRCSGTI